MNNNQALNNPEAFSEGHTISITRLTGLWALSESLIGGLLHASRILFRGMIMSSIAVIIICLIAHFSKKRGEIFKATIIVLMVKAALSPHSPVAAYLAVFLQGLLGEFLFSSKKFFGLSSVLLGFVVGILTGSQRIITYTLIFGNTFWEAINELVRYAAKELFFIAEGENYLNFSFILIIAYISIHVVFGVAVGFFAFTFVNKINSEEMRKMILSKNLLIHTTPASLELKQRKKSRWKKLSYLLIALLALITLMITYINPGALNLSSKSILLMLIRALLISIAWILLISPFLLKLIKELLNKQKGFYSNEIKNIISYFPLYKRIVLSIWKLSLEKKGFKRFSYLVTAVIINVLILKLPD